MLDEVDDSWWTACLFSLKKGGHMPLLKCSITLTIQIRKIQVMAKEGVAITEVTSKQKDESYIMRRTAVASPRPDHSCDCFVSAIIIPHAMVVCISNEDIPSTRLYG